MEFVGVPVCRLNVLDIEWLIGGLSVAFRATCDRQGDADLRLALLIRHRFNAELCATGVRLRSPVLFDFTCSSSRRHWRQKAAASGTHIFNNGAALWRIIAAGMKWVAPEDAHCPFPCTHNGTIFFDRLYKVIAARRFVAAVFSQERPDS